MDIKKEEDDEILSPENTYHADYLYKYNINGGLSPDGTIVKMEAVDDFCGAKEENLLLDIRNNVKQEDPARQKQEVEITYDASPFKIENVETGECSNRQSTLDQVTAVYNSTHLREPFVHCSQVKSEVLFEDIQAKEISTSNPVVVVINIEKKTFFERNFVCNVCMSVFCSLFSLQIHKKVKNKLCKKRFKCDKCNYTTPRKYALKNHNYLHTGLKPLKCDQCLFTCVQNSELLQHKLSHSGEKRFKCNKCEFKCTRNNQLNSHMSIHNTEKPFKCDLCDFKSAWETSLRRHKLSHTSVGQFKCDQCNFTSVWESSLSQHRLSHHNGERPFECNQCEFKSAHKCHLDHHVVIHTDEKPFICDVCEFKTARQAELRRHKLSHTGEKPFKCDQCDFASVFRYKLNEHKISHTGEKPFECGKCDYKSAWRSALRRHLHQHSGK